jgi:hypothetical protein
MMTAVLSATPAGHAQALSKKLSQLATRLMSALAESRARSATRELRRHEAFMEDLSRRQDHSSLFLDQAELLPVKI